MIFSRYWFTFRAKRARSAREKGYENRLILLHVCVNCRVHTCERSERYLPYMTEYVTALNLARLVGVTKRAVIHHIESGKLPARMIGCQYLITAQDALAFAEKR